MRKARTTSPRSSSSRPSGTPPGCNAAMARLIDRITGPVAAEEAGAPVGKLIGFRPVSLEAGKAVFELEAGPQHANPMGTLHGGVVCDVADAAMGVAYASTLADGESFTTLELRSTSCGRSGLARSSPPAAW